MSALAANIPSSAVDTLASWMRSALTFIRDNFKVEPDEWQLEVIAAWDRGDQRIAMKACKGPGKTALLAWLIWHFIATRDNPKIAATSITADNLKDNLWSELAKWRNKSPFLMQAFIWQKTSIVSSDPQLAPTWWASARSWNKNADSQQQADTLAGLHAENILFVLDEVGAIPDAVMASAEAILATDVSVDERGKQHAHTDARILMAGNPTLRSGPLWRACTRDRHLWTVVTITGDPDSNKRSPRISVKWARDQIETYGRDNPWVRANVFGEFPDASPMNFFPADLIEAARTRDPQVSVYDPLVLGVDVARFGDDRSIIYIRKGLDAKTHPPRVYRNLDTMQLAAKIAQLNQELNPDAIFIDEGGVGAGVVDRCLELKIKVIGVSFSGKPDRSQSDKDPTLYYNKRAEMHGVAREWLKHGVIPTHDSNGLPCTIDKEATAIQYALKSKDGRDAIILEPKDNFKDREGYSPDEMDAFVLTFAYPVSQSANAGRMAAQYTTQHARVNAEYEPLLVAHQEWERVMQSRNRTEYDPMEYERMN